MFRAPKVQTVAPPPPPAIEDTAARQAQYEDALRKRKGRAAAIVSQRNDQPETAGKLLLGS